jgi:hypothetical protein
MKFPYMIQHLVFGVQFQEDSLLDQFFRSLGSVLFWPLCITLHYATFLISSVNNKFKAEINEH